MADVISFADWASMKEMIKAGGLAVAGMSAAEAQAAMKATANNGLYVYNAINRAGASNVIKFPNTTAVEAAEKYLELGGTTSEVGAATASTGAVQESANLILTESATEAGKSGVAGLLTMPISTAFAALAPVLGVASGVGLYSANPSWWENLSRTLLPFCYEGTELLPVAVDTDGNTYYSEEAINALKTFLGEQMEGTASSSEYPAVGSVPFTSNPNFTTSIGGYEFEASSMLMTLSVIYSSVVITVTISKGTFNYKPEKYEKYWHHAHVSTTLKGTPYYYGSWTKTEESGIPSYTCPDGVTYQKVITTLIDGSISGGTPDELTQWQGDDYPSTTTPLKILTGYDEDGKPIYTPYYPVSTPIGDPGVSNDPEENPDPTTNPKVEPAVEPYISPDPSPAEYPETVPVSDPAPLPDPVPDPQPVPDPDADPEEDPDPEDTPDDPTDPEDPSDTGDGDTPIIPVIPTLPSAATGLLHVYNPTQSQIDAFGSWLWTTFSGELIETLSKLFNDPMDAVIGLHELYATPAVSGSATIRCGYLDSGIGANLVGSRYTTINCGSVVVEEYYQNYLDYTPYTQCYIYLPFVGIVPVSADDIIGNAVNITYHVDSYTGCVIAVVTVAKKGYSATVYQFEGNCAVEIPISSGYQSTLMSGLLAVAGTAITENPAVGMAAAHIGKAGLGKNAVQHSGSFGASYGAMGAKIPYIIVRRPTQKKIVNYSESYGYPAHKMVYVGNCQGYLRCREVRVTSTTATNIEKEMIVNALKSGVYVK